ncbi:MAG TPA: GNAT family N-acetyltransferase [Mycobacteriales bacterium]|nr:GNAT family N-acetyltransferase [Mycobacteriales bacterium]
MDAIAPLSTSTSTGVTITALPFDDPVSVVLVRELDADLRERYVDGADVHADASQFLAGNGGRFFVAHLDGEPVACAGIRHETDAAAELKRMYVRPAARGRGIARALLAACEDAAREIGYAELWLETGTMQPEAIALYLSSGYERVARFGQFAGADDALHLGKPLQPERRTQKISADGDSAKASFHTGS